MDFQEDYNDNHFFDQDTAEDGGVTQDIDFTTITALIDGGVQPQSTGSIEQISIGKHLEAIFTQMKEFSNNLHLDKKK